MLAGHNEGGTSIAYMNDQMRLTAAALDALGLYEGVFDMSMPWAIEVRKKIKKQQNSTDSTSHVLEQWNVGI